MKVLLNLNWKWAFKFYKKRFGLYFFYYLSRLRGQTFWEITVDGVRVKLGFDHPYQHLFGRLLFYGRHERTLLLMFKKYAEWVAAGSSIFDFGGYDGVYGLVAAVANPAARICIVEPDPINVDQIQKNVALNGLKNVTVLACAVGGSSGKVQFKSHAGATGGKIANEGAYSVDCKTLDDLVVADHANPGLLKFDILGAEYDTLMGAKETLAKIKPLNILLEFYPVAPEREIAFWNTMQACGFAKVYLYPRADGGSVYYWLFKVTSV